MNADILDDSIIPVLDEQESYVQILGVDTEDDGESVEVVSFEIDGGESVFIDVDDIPDDFPE